MKIFLQADLEGWWYIGQKICQIGQNGLCMLAAISKRANGMVFIFMKIGCVKSLFNEFIDDLLCSFQFHQNILKYTVSYSLSDKILIWVSSDVSLLKESVVESSHACTQGMLFPAWTTAILHKSICLVSSSKSLFSMEKTNELW